MQGILEGLAMEPDANTEKKSLYNRMAARIKTHLIQRRENETLQAVDLGAKEIENVRNEAI